MPMAWLWKNEKARASFPKCTETREARQGGAYSQREWTYNSTNRKKQVSTFSIKINPARNSLQTVNKCLLCFSLFYRNYMASKGPTILPPMETGMSNDEWTTID